MTLRDDWWKGKLSRADADYQRETFPALHQRQAEHFAFIRDQQDWVNAGHIQVGGVRLKVYTKILGDLGGIIWKNLADQKARQAYATGLRTWHHEFNIGIVDVTIDLYGRTVYILLKGSIAYFEFQTSGRPVVVEPKTSEGVTFSSYKTAVIGVSFDGKVAKPRIRTGERKTNAADASRIGRPQQVNLIDEPVIARSTGTERTNRKTKYPNLLYESWAPNHPYTGVFLRAYNMGGAGAGRYSNRGSIAVHMTRDILFDVPYMDSHGLSKVRPAYIRGEADWPRASSIQTVTSTEFGTREFGIYVDAFNQLFVFPTTQIQGIDPDDKLAQNVAERYVQGASIPLPGWVYVPPQKASEYYAATHGVQFIQAPELDWKFHPAGIKACAVVHERQAASFDSAYFGADVGAHPLTEPQFNTYRDANTGFAARNDAYISPSFLPQRYCIGTGLVEVAVQITLTGNDPENYTLALEVTEVRRPTTAQHATLLAGYVWYDIDDPVTTPKTYLVDRGDLCVLDVERYYRAADGATFSFLSVKKLTAGLLDDAPIVETELRAWNATHVIDYDFPTLSFVFGVHASETVNRTLQKRTGLPAGTGVLAYQILHQSVSVTTFNKFRQSLFPDTIPLTQKELIASRVEGDAREVMATSGGVWTFMPLNDNRTWATPELSNLRNYYSNLFGYKSVVATAPSAALTNWWTFGMWAYFVPTPLLYIAAPKFGWHLYADEIMNRLAVSPASTFFVHPNGTWAFFDQHRIYNPYGMYGPIDTLDALTPAIAEMELEHIIYDFVHLENKNGSLDTSFITLYNAARDAGAADHTLVNDDFDTISKDNLRATFIKQRYTHISGIQWLQLKMEWYPTFVGYFMETGYQGGPYVGGAATDAGGLIDLTLGAGLYSLPGYGGTLHTPYELNNPVTFSTCALIV